MDPRAGAGSEPANKHWNRTPSAGFAGWSDAEAASAREEALAVARLSERLDESDDDDGFFEQSEHSSLGEAPLGEWAEWQARVAARAADREARGALDVRALAAGVLRALPPAPRARPVDALLAATAGDDLDVSRVFLATLFLVRIARPPALRPPPFALRLSRPPLAGQRGQRGAAAGRAADAQLVLAAAADDGRAPVHGGRGRR